MKYILHFTALATLHALYIKVFPKYLQCLGQKTNIRTFAVKKKLFVCIEGKHEEQYDKTLYFSSFKKVMCLLLEQENVLIRICLEPDDFEIWDNNVVTSGPWELHFNSKDDLEKLKKLRSGEPLDDKEFEPKTETNQEEPQEDPQEDLQEEPKEEPQEQPQEEPSEEVKEVEMAIEFEIEKDNVLTYFKVGTKGKLEMDTASCGRELRTYFGSPCKVVIRQRNIIRRKRKDIKHFALCGGSCTMCGAKFKYFFQNNPFDEKLMPVENLRMKAIVKGNFRDGDVTRPFHDNVKPEGIPNYISLA